MADNQQFDDKAKHGDKVLVWLTLIVFVVGGLFTLAVVFLVDSVMSNM